jgi:hypothetical protein
VVPADRHRIEDERFGRQSSAGERPCSPSFPPSLVEQPQEVAPRRLPPPCENNDIASVASTPKGCGSGLCQMKMAQRPTTGSRTIDGKPFRRNAGAVTAE